MKVLVINCGSSSIKYQLIDMANNAELKAKGLVERIGLEMGEFTHKPVGKDKCMEKKNIHTMFSQKRKQFLNIVINMDRFIQKNTL